MVRAHRYISARVVNVRPQAKSINSTIFAEDVQGRVDITRTFLGRELNTEYLFGLFANIAANKNEFTLLGYPTSYEITHFAASQNIASASIRYERIAQQIKSLYTDRVHQLHVQLPSSEGLRRPHPD